MNWFKRLCLFLFGVSGVLSLVALSLTWVGPWTAQARTLLLENTWYFYTLEVLVCVSGLGLLLCAIVALFAPRNPKETIVATVAGGKITVTRTAISSQVRHVVEADGTCDVVSVRVKVRKRGGIRVRVRLRPHLPIDVVSRGEILYSELGQGLAKVCGDSVKSISIVFTEPEQQGTLSMYVDTDDTGNVSAPSPSASSGSGSSASEITVPMSSAAPEAPASEVVVPEAQEPATEADAVVAGEDAPEASDEQSDASVEEV